MDNMDTKIYVCYLFFVQQIFASRTPVLVYIYLIISPFIYSIYLYICIFPSK